MVKANLAGIKSQTRRVVKLPSWSTQDWDDFDPDEPAVVCAATGCMPDLPCPYGQAGDRLWVRETFMVFERAETMMSEFGGPTRPTGDYVPGGYGYFADLDKCGQVPVTDGIQTCLRTPKGPWKPSIHMPRAASRLSLEIVSVRVERVQDITEADAAAEGVQLSVSQSGSPILNISAKHKALDYIPVGLKNEAAVEAAYTYRMHFAARWDDLNKKRGFGWDANPYVWVISYLNPFAAKCPKAGPTECERQRNDVPAFGCDRRNHG